jgi:alpha-maltose-1-phosphate synthase
MYRVPLATAQRLQLAIASYAAIATNGRMLVDLGCIVLGRRRRPVPSAGVREVVMLVVSDARSDPRVERGARALAAAGYRVKIMWPDHPPPFAARPADWGPQITFSPLPLKAQDYNYFFPWLLSGAIYAAASREAPFAFHCHELNTAVTGLAAAQRAGAFCVCDFHEWYSENVSWDSAGERFVPHSRFKRSVFRLGEWLVLRYADAVLTVCQSIADELSREFSSGVRRIEVVKNIPPVSTMRPHYPSLRTLLAIPEHRFILLWQGGVGPSRMIEPIIEALRHAPNTVFVIRGPGTDQYGEGYRKIARRVGVLDRLFLLPPVPSADVVRAAHGADAGIWSLPNLSKNFYYALPNKIFEYLAAGLPVLAANYPEARALVEGTGVGLCFDPYDPADIAARMNQLGRDAALRGRFRRAIPAALEGIDAEHEWQKLAALYDRLWRADVTPATRSLSRTAS